MAENICEG